MKKKLLFLVIAASMVLTDCQGSQNESSGTESGSEISEPDSVQTESISTESEVPEPDSTQAESTDSKIELTTDYTGEGSAEITEENATAESAVAVNSGKGVVLEDKNGSKLYDMAGSEIDWRCMQTFYLSHTYVWTNDNPTELRELDGDETINGYSVCDVYSEYGYAGSGIDVMNYPVINYNFVCSRAGYTLKSPDDSFGGIDIEGIMSCDEGVWRMYIIRKEGDEQIPMPTVNIKGEKFGISSIDVGGEEVSVQPFPINLWSDDEDVFAGLDRTERYHAVLRVYCVEIESFSEAYDCPAYKMVARANVIGIVDINKV